MPKEPIERACADVGLIMSAYNLRRIFNTIPFNDLLEELIKTGQKIEKWLHHMWWGMIAGIPLFNEVI